MADEEGLKPSITERTFHGEDLSPIEHFLLSGSDNFKDNGLVSLTWLIDKKNISGNLDLDLFRVSNVTVSEPETITRVNELRRGERFKKKGIMPFLDIEEQVFLAGQGLSVGFVLGEVKPDGMVDPKWQLILIEGEDVEVENENLLKELKLTSRASEGFELQLEDGKLFLALKP